MLFFLFQHVECLVFGRFHDFALTWSLVVDATQVENAMNNHAVQLLIVWSAELIGICKYGIDRDDDVAADSLAFAIIKGDDVCVVVVTQILIVYFENLLIVNEKIAYFSDFLSVTGGHLANPVGGLSFLDVGEFYPLCFVSNHSLFFFGI